MPYSLTNIKEIIQPWAVRNIDPNGLSDFTDTEFLDMVNRVQDDLNVAGAINLERRMQTMSAGDFNFQVQGVIIKVLWIFFKSAAWNDQYWGFVQDTLVFKETPTDDVVIDCEYVRKCEDLALAADELDLPEAYMHDFIDLLKKRMQVEFGQLEEALYLQYLEGFGRLAGRKQHTQKTGGTWRHWFIPEKGDDLYDITDNYVSKDSIYTGVDGKYYIYE